jgi:hypothetical protein
MLKSIGHVSKVPEFIKEVKSGDGETRLMGFGHRVYKSYDPRAKVIKRVADEVFDVTGKNPLLDIALELERIALQDDYFVKRKLYPNVDFYSGLIYEALGFPMDFFTVLFAIPRTVGWAPSGRRWCSTRSRRSPARGRSTPDPSAGITSPSTSADDKDHDARLHLPESARAPSRSTPRTSSTGPRSSSALTATPAHRRPRSMTSSPRSPRCGRRWRR